MYAVILGKGKRESFLVSDECASFMLEAVSLYCSHSGYPTPWFTRLTEAVHKAAQHGLVFYYSQDPRGDDGWCYVWATRRLRRAVIKQIPDDVLHVWLRNTTTNAEHMLKEQEYVLRCRRETNRKAAYGDMLETICQLDNYVDETERVNDALNAEIKDLREQLAVQNTGFMVVGAQNEYLQHRVGQLKRESVRHVQQVLYLTRELDQAKAEYAWLSSKTSNNKEQSAMKFNLEMKDVTSGGTVAISSLTINAEVPDEMLDLLSTVVKNMVKPQKHTCTCRDGDEDKRPSAIIRPRAKGNHENDFMPGDMD